MAERWEAISGDSLAQGDYLPGIGVVRIDPNADWSKPDCVVNAEVCTYDMVVVTQSCDLQNGKAQTVAMCPLETVKARAGGSRAISKKDLEEMWKGRREGSYLLPSPVSPVELDSALVVELREVHTLPIEYAKQHASKLGKRWRMRSPFLEHFSQAFGRCYMRVGLPAAKDPFSR